MKQEKAYYHLPGLFEFYELYREFLPLFRAHREYFYDWCDIGSIYGAPADCVWGGGRAGFGEHDPKEVLALTREYGISARLTFSNSLLREEHLSDKKCNALCALFEQENPVQSGVIVHSELLLDYLKTHYPQLYFVSSTTKVLTEFQQLRAETAPGRVPLCGAGLPAEQSLWRAGQSAAGAERQGGISLQRVLLGRMPGQKALL